MPVHDGASVGPGVDSGLDLLVLLELPARTLG